MRHKFIRQTEASMKEVLRITRKMEKESLCGQRVKNIRATSEMTHSMGGVLWSGPMAHNSQAPTRWVITKWATIRQRRERNKKWELEVVPQWQLIMPDVERKSAISAQKGRLQNAGLRKLLLLYCTSHESKCKAIFF